jgi:hypothetical protein
MSNLFPAVRVAPAVLALTIAACNPPPWTVSQSPDAITLRWYSDEVDIAAAQTVADRHCRSTGKTAALTSNEQSGSVQVAEFRCR